MTIGETYRCDSCGRGEWSDCGNPLHRLDDGTDLCDTCFETREEKCECGKLVLHSELTTIEGMKLCKPCVEEHNEEQPIFGNQFEKL